MFDNFMAVIMQSWLIMLMIVKQFFSFSLLVPLKSPTFDFWRTFIPQAYPLNLDLLKMLDRLRGPKYALNMLLLYSEQLIFAALPDSMEASFNTTFWIEMFPLTIH